MPDGYTDTRPYRSDTIRQILVKMLQVLNAGGIGTLSGHGAPEGVVTASPGSLYIDLDLPAAIYIKVLGTGNTGWSPPN